MKKYLIVGLLLANTAYAGGKEAWNNLGAAAVQGFLNGVDDNLNGPSYHPPYQYQQFDYEAFQRQQQLNELRKLQEENLRLQNEQLRRQQFMSPQSQYYRPPLNCITVGNYTTCN